MNKIVYSYHTFGTKPRKGKEHPIYKKILEKQIKQLSTTIIDLWTASSGVIYNIEYCKQCEQYIITCPTCEFSSCSGSGCDVCTDDFTAFIKYDDKCLSKK